MEINKKPSKQLSSLLSQIKELEYKVELLNKIIELGKTNGDLNERGHHVVSMLRNSGLNDIYIAELFKVNVNTMNKSALGEHDV